MLSQPNLERSVNLHSLPVLEELEPRQLLSGSMTGIEVCRDLYVSGYPNEDFQEVPSYWYNMFFTGTNLTEVKVDCPWGNFDSLDTLDGWDGSRIEVQLPNETTFTAWTDDQGLNHLAVSWNDISDEQWAATAQSPADVLVTFDGGSWSGTIQAGGMDIPDAPHYLTSPSMYDECIPKQPTFEWPRWQAPANGYIELSVEGYDVTLGADQTRWTPPQALTLNTTIELDFVTERTDNSLGIPVTWETSLITDTEYSLADAVTIIGHHDGAVARGWSFTDNYDGDIVTPILTGPGWAELVFDADGSLANIRLHDTTARSNFRLAVNQQGQGDGWVMVGAVVSSGTASLGTLDLRQVDWPSPDGIFFRGAIGTLRLGEPTDEDNVDQCPQAFIDCDASDTLRLTGGDVSCFELYFSGTLTASVQSWYGGIIRAYRIESLDILSASDTGDGGPCEITAGQGGIGRISVVGDNLDAEITSEGAIESITVRAAVVYDEDGEGEMVGGSLCYADITADGIGQITVIGGDLDDSNISVGQGGIGTICVIGGDLLSTTIQSVGPIGSIVTKSGMGNDGQGSPVITDGDISGCGITVSAGGIGRIRIVGGCLYGTDIDTAGPICSITVKVVVTTDEDGEPEILGGGIEATTIEAGATGEEDIGRIALRGGSLGSETNPIDIDCGHLGALRVRAIKYVSDTVEMPMLDRHGCARTNSDGDELVRISPLYELSGGEAWMDLKTAGTVDSIHVAGGALGGKLEAAGGIGEIRLRSVALVAPGHYRGMTCVTDEDQMAVADLLADIVVGSGDGQSIGSITLRGGSIQGDVDAAGSIGRIRATSFGIVSDDEPELSGGSILSDNFNSTGIKSLKLANPSEPKGVPVADPPSEDPFGGFSGAVILNVGG